MTTTFKSALTFFFLFFLHGTSIGNGQQGISHNTAHAATKTKTHSLKNI